MLADREIRGAIFDLDGVLVDTAGYHFEGWQRIAHGLGFDLQRADGELLKGVSRDEALMAVLRVGRVQVGDRERARLSAVKNAWFLEQVANLDPGALLPGAQDALRWLQSRQVPIALASSSENAIEILERTGIRQFFVAVVDGHVVRRAKPDPEIFLLAARGLGLPAAQCVVFEDAEAGVAGARRAGCAVVGLGDPLVLHEADLVVGSLAEIALETIFTDPDSAVTARSDHQSSSKEQQRDE